MTYDIAHGEPRPSGLTSNEIFAVSLLNNALAINDSLQSIRLARSTIIVGYGRVA